MHGGWIQAGVFTQAANGTLSPEKLFPVPYATRYPPKALAVGDVSGDGLPDIVAADYNNGLVVLRSTGQVESWGFGGFGQLGDGAKADRAEAVPSLEVSQVVSINAGGYHSLAAARDGRVWSWGLNHVGQLGNGQTSDRTAPAPVRIWPGSDLSAPVPSTAWR